MRIKFCYTIFLLWVVNLTAQVKNIGLPEIQNYKRTDYKGGTQNWGIDQDKNGNIYFANNNGLLQFDGTSWTKYTIPNSSLIRSVKIDKSGRIFIGGYSEFGYFKADEKGKLQYHSLIGLVDKKIKIIDFIWRIHIYGDEIIFQSFARLYSYKNNKLSIIEAPNRFQFSFLVNGRLYLQDNALGLMEYKNGHLTSLKNTQVLNGTEAWSIMPMDNEKLLVATIDKGLFLYENEQMIPWETEANNFIKKNSSLGGVIIKEKFIVINSVLDGIIICDKAGKIIQHINRKKGLQNNTVLSSFVDSRNNLWLGLDNGITFVNENSPVTYFGFSYELSTVYASVFFNDYLYVATNRGLFYHTLKGPFREDTFTLVEGTNSQAWNIQVIDGQLFCGHNRGAFLIEGGKSVKTLDTKGYWGFKAIPGKPGFLIGCNYNGFAIFEKTPQGWKFNNQIDGLETSASNFEIDADYLWLKKDNLIYQMTISPDLKKFTSIKMHKNLPGFTKEVQSLQHINNKVYFQTDNHFFIYLKEQEVFYEDKKVTALFKNLPRVRSINEDAFGNIWYIFEESIGMLMKDANGEYKNIIAPFSNLTGNLVYDYPSVNTVDRSNIFIGLTDGLAHFDTQLLNNYVTRPKAFIRTFSFPGDTLVLGNGQTKFEKYSIPYAANSVRFTFSSPTYENLENVEFSYQLEGFDDNWSKWSTLAMKEYTNLKEGGYKMKVKVRNSYGIQSEESVISFSVAPPWYRHWLAYLLYIVLIVVATYYIRAVSALKSVRINITKR
ncbi:triple tyrosine motif-containing protein [Flavobacterium sp. 3HN19-14]|uniref:triple tyrosine motif-containing protein n=1 Tax=Flavobacterium sp. 3HN19-14 TaxID=3448133 RepID=UPI003EE0683E